MSASDFEAFYSSEFDRVVRAVYVIVGQRDEAIDITQEAFARTWASWDRIRRKDLPMVFVLATARNLSRSHLRRLVRHRRTPGVWEVRDRTEAADGTDLAVRAALARLPEQQRWAVVLCDLADLGSTEAASIMGIAPSTVRVHLARARERLKQLLVDDTEAAAGDVSDARQSNRQRSHGGG
jgi:RNA polymerase sigma-70 factor, ECF subfamily